MATATTSTAAIMDRILAAFIEDGDLTTLLTSHRFHIFAIIKFVDFNEGVLRVLIAGSCPHCNSRHVRNICNLNYTKECLFPILSSKFTQVKLVQPILSYDMMFDSIVVQKGGNVSYPFFDDQCLPFSDQTVLMMDQHPNIDGFIKFFSHLKGGTDYKELERDDLISRIDLCSRFVVSWTIEQDTAVLGADGQIIRGIDNIRSQEHHLSSHVFLRIDDIRQTKVLSASGFVSFKSDVYKVVTF